MADTVENKQLLHLVFGGELESLKGVRFNDLNALDIVGYLSQLCQRACRLEIEGAANR